MSISYFQSLFLQFFDNDGDGIVSEADLSGHIPITSLVDQLHSNHQEQKQRHKSKQSGGDDERGMAHQNEVATIFDTMNLGNYHFKSVIRPYLKLVNY